MVTGGKMLAACVALAMLSAAAQAQWLAPLPAVWDSQDGSLASKELHLVGRRVPVWRGSATAKSGPTKVVAMEEQIEGEPVPSGTIVSEPMTGLGDDSHHSDEHCDTCGEESCCCESFWQHRSSGYGEYLYLKASDVNMVHGLQVRGTDPANSTPFGHVGDVDPRDDGGFRVGYNHALDCSTSVSAGYTQFRSSTTDTLSRGEGNGILDDFVKPLVIFPIPNIVTNDTVFSRLDAIYDIDYKFVDIELQRLLWGSECSVVNYTVGTRYGKLQQTFGQLAEFSVVDPFNSIVTLSDITFEGVGLRAGLDGRRKIGCRGLSMYGKGFVNVMFGEFDSEYANVGLLGDELEPLAFSTWSDDRVVPVLEYELGTSWTSRNGRLTVSGGYYTAFWFNVITTAKHIQAVQTANFLDRHDTISFNGLTVRAELRF